MDYQSDSPHPPSPTCRATAALDRDLSTHVVPSTQAETPPPPAGVTA